MKRCFASQFFFGESKGMKNRFLIFNVVVLMVVSLALPCMALPDGVDPRDMLSKETILASMWEADISQIREAYAQNLFTCTELTAYYLERIEVYNETYNCFITLCKDALEQAALRDEEIASGVTDKLLLGIPIVIKDNIDYAGYYTTNGNKKRDSRVAYSNATIVDYLLEQGAVIIGKTNMSTGAVDHFASKSLAVGETKNAYNPQLSSAGSSGGSASAVSLNFSVGGIGTDTNSSLRLPAAFNGGVSMRVTVKSLSTKGITPNDTARDVPGVITRTVMDQAIILDAMSGGHTNYAENLNGDALTGLRIGVLKEFVSSGVWGRNERNIDPEIMEAFDRAVEELRQCGVEIVEVSIPTVFDWAYSTYSEGSSYIPKMYKVIESAFAAADVSAVIFPSYLSTPLRTGYDDNGKYWYPSGQTMINNTSKFSSCSGLPEIVVPIGQHSLGAGIGMEIAALKNEEQLLLDIAYSYTLRYDHRPQTENAPDLYAEHYKGNVYELLDQVETAWMESQTEPETEPTQQSTEESTAPVTEPEPEPIQPTKPQTNNTRWVACAVLVPAGIAVAICIKRKMKKIEAV